MDVLNCFPTKVVLLKEFEDRLTLIERVAKTLLEAMIDCILRIFVCVCVCVYSLCDECRKGIARGSLRSFQRLMCEIISLRTTTILIGSRKPKSCTHKTTSERVFKKGGLAYNSWIPGIGHKFLHFTISG